MEKKTNKTYKEVKIDGNGNGMDSFYKNPLTKVFQYEYALYTTVSRLFASVRCRSRCVDSLELYFKELPHKANGNGNSEGQKEKDNGNKRNTQEGFLSEMAKLVDRDVIGHITFPMMNICAAEVRTIAEKDGTHSFVFTDDIYGFSLHLDMSGKGHPRQIMVETCGQLK